jgi:hypothetical protein
MLENAHPWLMLAHPQLRLKQQLLRSRDRKGKWYENILTLNYLLWVAEYGRERTRESKRSYEYLAPTWSWASIDGEISRLGYISYTDDRGIMIDILTVRVDLATASPFGQITGAFL